MIERKEIQMSSTSNIFGELFGAEAILNNIIYETRQSIYDALVTAESDEERNRYKHALIMIDNIRDAVKDGCMVYETGALMLSNLINVLGIGIKEE